MGQRAEPRALYTRWMIGRDLPEVLAIERASFAAPWTEADFRRVLFRRNAIAHVAEAPDGVLIGYIAYELCRTRFEILSLAVGPRWRRCGVGGQLVAKLTGKLEPCRRRSVRLVVRDGNLAAQLFFRASGFVATEVLRGYYEGSGEDGYCMEYRL